MSGHSGNNVLVTFLRQLCHEIDQFVHLQPQNVHETICLQLEPRDSGSISLLLTNVFIKPKTHGSRNRVLVSQCSLSKNTLILLLIYLHI